jgi:hypothetical protein
MALRQQLSTEEPLGEPTPPVDDGRRSFDTWQHTTMLGTDDSADDSDAPDNVIRGLD